MLEYILKTSICWAAFYALYFLFLRKETFFKTNRVYLLLTLCLGAIIPLMDNVIPIRPAQTVEIYAAPLNLPNISEVWNLETHGSIQEEIAYIKPITEQYKLNLDSILFILYILGVAFFLVRLLYGLSKIWNLYKKAEIKQIGEIKIAKSQKKHVPFSFFNILFMSDDYETKKEDKDKIILHEKAHISGRHSYDVLLVEVLAILFWCVPFIYLYRKSIKTNHEFLADAKVLQTTSIQSYGHLLLTYNHIGLKPFIASHFTKSQLKQRILMMTRSKSTPRNFIKYFIALPILFVLLLMCRENTNNNINAQTSNYLYAPETLVDKISQIELSINDKDIPTVIAGQNKLDNMDNEVLTNIHKNVYDEIVSKNTSGKNMEIDHMPRFPGCEEEEELDKESCAKQSLLHYISTQIRYPNNARLSRTQGVTVVEFVVDKTGKITKPRLVRNIGDGCGKESLRLVKSMPDWTPGMNNGDPVDVLYTLPIKYTLPKLGVEHAVEIDEKLNDEVIDQILMNLPTNSKISPAFPGCENAIGDKDKCLNHRMYAYIYDNVNYPKESNENKLKGIMRARFEIGKSGEVKNAKITKGVSPSLDKEVLSVISKMPAWYPGIAKEDNFIVTISIPIVFGNESKEMETSPKLYIDGRIDQRIKEKLRKAYKYSYENDVTHSQGLTKETLEDYKLTIKAIEMTMKEFDNSVVSSIDTDLGETKSIKEWQKMHEQALDELLMFSMMKSDFDYELTKKMFDRVYQNKIRISFGQE